MSAIDNVQAPSVTESNLASAALEQMLTDRRVNSRVSSDGRERRQFASSYSELSTEGAELGVAIDNYKMVNRRRFITYDEILSVFKSLGYTRG